MNVQFYKGKPTKRAPDGAAPQDMQTRFANFRAIILASLANPPRR